MYFAMPHVQGAVLYRGSPWKETISSVSFEQNCFGIRFRCARQGSCVYQRGAPCHHLRPDQGVRTSCLSTDLNLNRALSRLKAKKVCIRGRSDGSSKRNNQLRRKL